MMEEFNKKNEYIKAMRSVKTLKDAGVNANTKINLLDKIYFEVPKVYSALQSLFEPRKKPVKALNPGIAEKVNKEPLPWELTAEQLNNIRPEEALTAVQQNGNSERDIENDNEK